MKANFTFRPDNILEARENGTSAMDTAKEIVFKQPLLQQSSALEKHLRPQIQRRRHLVTLLQLYLIFPYTISSIAQWGFGVLGFWGLLG